MRIRIAEVEDESIIRIPVSLIRWDLGPKKHLLQAISLIKVLKVYQGVPIKVFEYSNETWKLIFI